MNKDQNIDPKEDIETTEFWDQLPPDQFASFLLSECTTYATSIHTIYTILLQHPKIKDEEIAFGVTVGEFINGQMEAWESHRRMLLAASSWKHSYKKGNLPDEK
jgi:hypothetical protein